MIPATETSRRALSVVGRRVAMADVDGAQILYFTSPLRWMEAQFTAWLAEIGHPLSSLLGSGVGMPIAGIDVRFESPLRLDDVIEQRLYPGDIGRTSFAIDCDVIAPGRDEPAVSLHLVHVWASHEHAGDPFIPTPVPEWLRTALTS